MVIGNQTSINEVQKIRWNIENFGNYPSEYKIECSKYTTDFLNMVI